MVISVFCSDSVDRWDLLTDELFLGRGIVIRVGAESVAIDATMRRQSASESLG